MNGLEHVIGRLTPRGAELLDSLLDEMREEVLQAAARRSVGAEISARDVIEAFEERTGERRIYDSTFIRRRRRLNQLLIVYALTGALTAVVALIVSTMEVRSELAPLLATTSAAIVGVSLALLIVVRQRESTTPARMRDEERRQDGFAAFIDRWLRIESLLRLIVAKDLGTSAGELPLGAILEASRRSGRLDDSSYQSLRQLLSVRNEAVHGGILEKDSLSRAIREAERLVMQLEEELAQ